MRKLISLLNLVTALAMPSISSAQFCPADYSPVCGEDGARYSNECVAEAAGATPRAEGALISFAMGDDVFTFWSENSVFIDEALDTLREGRPSRIPHFRKVVANSDCSEPHSFSVDPNEMEFVDITMEICDANISYVESNRDSWIEEVGGWCPWSIEILEVHDRRTSSAQPGEAAAAPAVEQRQYCYDAGCNAFCGRGETRKVDGMCLYFDEAPWGGWQLYVGRAITCCG